MRNPDPIPDVTKRRALFREVRVAAGRVENGTGTDAEFYDAYDSFRKWRAPDESACDHGRSWTGVDDAPIGAPVKAWRCDDCGHEQDIPR